MLLQRRQLSAVVSAGSYVPRPSARLCHNTHLRTVTQQHSLVAPARHIGTPNLLQIQTQHRRHVRAQALEASQGLGVALFFAPSIIAVIYAYFRGKGNVTDGLSRMLTDLSQGYFQPDVGGKNIPVSQGELSDLAGDEPLFKALYKWFIDCGGVYKLVFGPKAFIVISDPVVVRYILKENAFNFDKGVLAEILEPIMGKGLIPADLDTWRVRRRAIVPAFHKSYYEAMVGMFGRCTEQTCSKLEKALAAAADGRYSFANLLDLPSLTCAEYDVQRRSNHGELQRASNALQARSCCMLRMLESNLQKLCSERVCYGCPISLDLSPGGKS
eukprot:GHRR01027464.1.p1 GENE.GHRR01027464.1~~GHRR01027464.1.p1  ORF type:complete len:328 (+),score=64.04 GHRR01027464.1:93-1076(+)